LCAKECEKTTTHMQLGTVCRIWLSRQFREHINMKTAFMSAILEHTGSVLLVLSFIAKQVL
jgi:hypothetical protein